MLNNYNNLQDLPSYSVRAILASPNNCVAIYNQYSVAQVVQGLMIISSPLNLHHEQIINATIPIKNPQSKLLDLLVTENTRIVTLSVTIKGEFQIVSYFGLQTHTTNLSTNAPRFISSHRSHTSIIYVFEGTDPQPYSQVIVFQPCHQKVTATGLLPNKFRSCHLTDGKIYILTDQALNVYQYHNNHLQHLQTYPVKDMVGFVFSSGLLVLYSRNKILLRKDQKQVGMIQYSDILKILPVTLGLVVMCKHVVLHLQRRGGTFVELEKLQSQVGYKNIEISNKQDLMLTVVETGAIELVKVDFNKVDQHDQRRTFIEKRIVKDGLTIVSSLTLSAGSNPCLILVRQNPNKIVIYSKVTLNNVLEYNIDSTPVYDVQIEPNRPYFLLSVNGILKKYLILYDRIQEQSQISLRVRRLVYSPTGAFVACLVGSTKYSKVQILSSDDLKEVAVLWTGQEICDIVWGSHDMNLYVVVENGYQRWSLTDCFKTKNCFQTRQIVVKASYNFWKSALILLTKSQLMLVVVSEQVESTIITGCIVTSVASLGRQILMAQQDGTLRYSNIDSKIPATILKLFHGEFSLQSVNESQVVCVSNSRKTVLVLRSQQCVSNQKDVVFVERALIKSLYNEVSLNKQKSKKSTQDMQAGCNRLQEEYKQLFEHQKSQFIKKIREVYQVLEEEKANGKQLQRLVTENKQRHQSQQLKGIGELERLYDRKITILTNRLMTQSEMNCRNSIVSLEKVRSIEASHIDHVRELNCQFATKLKQLHLLDLTEKERTQMLVREYEEKLASGQQESNDLIQKLQFEYQELLTNLNRINFSWEDKFKKSILEKFSAEESMHKQSAKGQQLEKENLKLRQSLGVERNRIEAYNQQIDKLSNFVKGLQQQLDRQKANSFQLSQTNQVLSFKILESRQVILPKQQQLEDLKGKFHIFQAEFQKNLHQIGQQGQLIQQLRKENSIARKQILQLKDMYKKQRKTHVDLFYNIKQIVTESVPEDWNKNLKKLYQEIMKKGYSSDIAENTRKNKKEIMEEIHRSKNHLEQCLDKVVSSNNKIQERKSHEMTKKLRQNADLLQEINDLRTRLKKCEHLVPAAQKECKIKRRSQTVKTEADQVAGARSTGLGRIDQERGIKLFKASQQQRSSQFKEFESTSMEFNRTSLRKSERFGRTTFRKGISLHKYKHQQNKQEEIQFLSRKLQLQEKIILSLRAKVNGIDI